MKTHTMNYNDPTSVMKDFHWNVFRPGLVNMKVAVGDAVLLTAKEAVSSRYQDDVVYAVAMIGTVKEAYIEEGNVSSDCNIPAHAFANEGPTHLVEWKDGPLEIDSDFSCVQGGYIAVDDRAEILSQLALV